MLRGDFSLPKRKYVINSGIIGVLLLSVGTGAVVWSQQYIPTSTTSLIIAFEPLVVMLMMWGLLAERPPRRAFQGALVSISGMALLISQPLVIGGGDAWKGLTAIVCGMLCWGAGMLLRQRLDLGPNRVRGTAMQMIIGGVFMLVFSLLINEWEGWSIAQVTRRSAYAWVYLVIFGSIAAFSAFNYLLGKVSADKVSTNTYVNPVVAVLLGGSTTTRSSRDNPCSRGCCCWRCILYQHGRRSGTPSDGTEISCTLTCHRGAALQSIIHRSYTVHEAP